MENAVACDLRGQCLHDRAVRLMDIYRHTGTLQYAFNQQFIGIIASRDTIGSIVRQNLHTSSHNFNGYKQS
jgi:hypothetical protein